ncbi:MAG TPA: PAS domain S-box protein, partial [Thermoanaerobaculia bacterium]|nr:PAS domain S-box protein [Thermoanaerobaculia bacterium]
MSLASFPISAPVRVLLLEDTDIDANAIESALQQFRFDVRRARTLAEALVAVRSDEFDVILSDLGTPDSNGLDTLEALLRHAAPIPVVVMTGRGDEATALRAVAAGAQDYLLKGNTDAGTLVRSIRYAMERGRANEERNRSEARMRTILEGALDAVVSINQDGVIVWWNRRAEEIFGWPRADVVGRPLDLIIPERFRDMHQRGLRNFIDTGDTALFGRRVEWLALRRDGSEFPAEVRITAEAEGGAMTFTAFISDITERRRAEEERAASETKFRALVEHATDLIFTADGDDRFTYVSPGVTRMLGYEPAELLGRHIDSFVHPDDLGYVRLRFRGPAAGGAIPILAEFRFRHKHGSWRYLEVLRANRLADPAVRAVVGNVRDVTGRRHAQQTLDHLRRRYELILNSIIEGVIGIDLTGAITFENPAAAAMLGWGRDAMIGRLAHATVH